MSLEQVPITIWRFLGLIGSWFREIAGWLLVALGIYFCYICYQLLRESRFIEAGPLAVIGLVIFRGGIHLLKVASAMWIYQLARDGVKPDPTLRSDRPGHPTRPAARPGSRPVQRLRPTASH